MFLYRSNVMQIGRPTAPVVSRTQVKACFNENTLQEPFC